VEEERLVGSVRRECLNHVIVLGARHLHRIMKSYFRYYHRSRTHLSLDKDAPDPRAVHPPLQSAVGSSSALPDPDVDNRSRERENRPS
jgi:hypothetical protein